MFSLAPNKSEAILKILLMIYKWFPNSRQNGILNPVNPQGNQRKKYRSPGWLHLGNQTKSGQCTFSHIHQPTKYPSIHFPPPLPLLFLDLLFRFNSILYKGRRYDQSSDISLDGSSGVEESNLIHSPPLPLGYHPNTNYSRSYNYRVSPRQRSFLQRIEIEIENEAKRQRYCYHYYYYQLYSARSNGT